MPQTLIIGGCPRSGTTALARLLNCHPRIVLGDERYYWLFEAGELDPALFEADRFFDLRPDDRHWREGRDPLPPDATPGRYQEATWTGDKYPPLWRAYDAVDRLLPGARILCIVRDPIAVAESYAARARDDDDAWHFDAHRAVRDWNEAVGAALHAVDEGRDVLVVTYERLFTPHADLSVLFGALGLPAGPARPACDAVLEEANALHRRLRPYDPEIRCHVERHADMAAYRDLAKHCLFAAAD